MANINRTPGVYIEEINAFPNSMVPVATAVPAFIGYTEKAIGNKQSLHLKPTKISSYGEYLQFFGGEPTTKFTVDQAEGKTTRLRLEGPFFSLHRQMKMFFSNGGSDCYIVSVGGYLKDGGENEVTIEALRSGIKPLEKEPEPTMVVIPELMTMPVARSANGEPETESVIEAYGLYLKVLHHCGKVMRNRFAIMDVWMDREAYDTDDYRLDRDIKLFRDNSNSSALGWGAAYYPWLKTTAISPDEIGIINIANLGKATDITPYEEADFAADGAIIDQATFQQKHLDRKPSSLTSLLDLAIDQELADGKITKTQAEPKKKLLEDIPVLQAALAGNSATADQIKTLQQALLAISPSFKAILQDIRQYLNLLPPSATMAGIYSMVDNTVGVWQSPANVGIGSVIKPAISISSEQQEDLNIPLSGKAVNAIRSFPGKGTLVWGARTLDGNSQDWRYISVRRTVIFIEQSIKYAAEPYVFEPNTAATWSNIKALLTNFLTNVWQSGALAGATPEDAFSVDVGLGSTMTPVDILDGYMRISVKVAVTRPAEFIVITFEQKMQQS